jgi:cell division protein YceG involved in septum cleavage
MNSVGIFIFVAVIFIFLILGLYLYYYYQNDTISDMSETEIVGDGFGLFIFWFFVIFFIIILIGGSCYSQYPTYLSQPEKMEKNEKDFSIKKKSDDYDLEYKVKVQN